MKLLIRKLLDAPTKALNKALNQLVTLRLVVCLMSLCQFCSLLSVLPASLYELGIAEPDTAMRLHSVLSRLSKLSRLSRCSTLCFDMSKESKVEGRLYGTAVGRAASVASLITAPVLRGGCTGLLLPQSSDIL